jgi:hypothetical protein
MQILSKKMNHRRLAVVALFLAAVTTCIYPINAAILRIQESGPTLTITPASVLIKVGESANVSLTLSNSPPSFNKVCFGVEDFPTSGFVTTINPACVNIESSDLAVLTVEATPAAAPQNFTAYVVATAGNWTARVPINVTVEPAMPAWIPWSIILVFVLILLIPVIIKKKTKQR